MKLKLVLLLIFSALLVKAQPDIIRFAYMTNVIGQQYVEYPDYELRYTNMTEQFSQTVGIGMPKMVVLDFRTQTNKQYAVEASLSLTPNWRRSTWTRVSDWKQGTGTNQFVQGVSEQQTFYRIKER